MLSLSFLIKINTMKIFKITKKYGITFNPTSLWIGAHHSLMNNRWCVNLIPTITFYINDCTFFEVQLIKYVSYITYILLILILWSK